MDVHEAVLDQLIGSGARHFAGMAGSTSAPHAGGPCVIDTIVDPEARPPRTEISRNAR